MSKDVASYGFIRTINYEDIFLLMIERGLVFENILSILLNAKKNVTGWIRKNGHPKKSLEKMI